MNLAEGQNQVIANDLLIDLIDILSNSRTNPKYLGKSIIAVLSIRPNLGFGIKKIVSDNEYYTQKNFLKQKNQNKKNYLRQGLSKPCPSIPEEPEMHTNKLNNDSGAGQKLDIQVLTSYYEVLKDLEDEVDIFNQSSESTLSVPDCVHKITNITGHKAVQNIDINAFLNKSIKESNLMARNIQELKEHKKTITKEQSCGTEERFIDVIEMIQGVSTKINHELKTERREQISRINRVCRDFMEKNVEPLRIKVKNFSDDVNPHDMAVNIGRFMPNELKPITDPYIKPLIIKCSSSAQYFLYLYEDFIKIIKKLITSLMNSVYDLD